MNRLMEMPTALRTPAPAAALPTLDQLAIKWGTDKRMGIHGYTRWYDALWGAKRLEPLTFMEIGVQSGASIRMWEDYFSAARIVGMDVDPRCAALASPRVRIIIGSQDDATLVPKLKSDYPDGFDIIIDDGSHVGEHQQKTFPMYFTRLLKPGGTYVIEDLHCAYHAKYRGHVEQTTIQFLKDRVDDLLLNGSSGIADYIESVKAVEPTRDLNPYEKLIESIQFVRGMVIVTKQPGGASSAAA